MDNHVSPSTIQNKNWALFGVISIISIDFNNTWHWFFLPESMYFQWTCVVKFRHPTIRLRGVWPSVTDWFCTLPRKILGQLQWVFTLEDNKVIVLALDQPRPDSFSKTAGWWWQSKICQLPVVDYQDVQTDSSAVCKQFNSVPNFNLQSTVCPHLLF